MSTTTQAQGMSGDLVKADWPPLQLSEVRALLADFPNCEEPIEICTVSPRPFSAASVVSTKSGRVFVKRHHRAVRDRDGLREEHRFQQHLIERGAPVPLVYQTRSGETAIERGVWSYEVREVPVSVDLYQDAHSWTPYLSTAHAYSAGATLAQLHLAAQGYDAPARKPQPLVSSFAIFSASDPAAAMERYLALHPALGNDLYLRNACDEALQLLAPFHRTLHPLHAALAPLWTHNDLHPTNLLWSNTSLRAQVASVIDFGLCDRTNAVHDLAIAIERSIVDWLDLTERGVASESVRVAYDLLTALLDGYQSVRPLSDQEAASLAPMLSVCHVEFALTEADYFRGVLRSEYRTKMALLDYLVGHARWFHSAGGKKLLSAITQWTATRKQPQRDYAGVAK